MRAGAGTTLLAVRRLKVHYPLPGEWPWSKPGWVKAVDGVDFNLAAGETLGIVGESGCGKSTLARALVGLQPVTSGGVTFDGHNLASLDAAGWRPFRREIQIVFQDPLASLDPRMTIGAIVAEPLQALYPELGRAEREARVAQMLERVGLSKSLMDRYPHEFSGGQCQRVGIARALVVRPRILVCDEPVSALDVSVQAQVVNLLADLQAEYGLAMIFIAHDLAVVRHISRRVLVMYLGKVMEQADGDALFATPVHPYTRALLAAAPAPDPAAARSHRREPLEGEVPSPANPPTGCVFVTRCPIADAHCARHVPVLTRAVHGGYSACHFTAAPAG
ncbi:MAG TPA: oligopeptide/dipeptide ABC transporter ATP-binding protein [Nevskiaceae bacterium]|nr:oligopeptide/dipeptide ABC transporter ATP-binding protein [Nevskiaceae bacterium]